MTRPTPSENEVLLLNPATCGVYKNGGARYKVDHNTGRRSGELDNELGENVDTLLAGLEPAGAARVAVDEIFARRILVPRYYDERWVSDFRDLVGRLKVHTISLGDLENAGVISVRPGHGSPGNDMRAGHIPYIKVSDVRSLRVNVNPTNLVSRAVANALWGGTSSGIAGWDLITPNRASSNIGEFAVLLPGEEERVLTREFFVLRVVGGHDEGWDWAYLLWALCLKAVRKQWQRVALMQTNREDVGDRYKEILLPSPRDLSWAREVSKPFREYFETIAQSRQRFVSEIIQGGFEYIASIRSVGATAPINDGGTSVEEPAAEDSERRGPF